MNSEGHDAVRLTDLSSKVMRPAFSPDGRTIFFSVSAAGRCNIWQVPANGGEPTPVIDADVYHWAVSPDGARIAYSTFDKDARTVQTRIHSLTESKTVLILDISPETWTEWASDGNTIFYNTASDKAQNIWAQNLDGSNPRPVTTFDSEQVFRFDWSPGGKNLACIRHTVSFDAVELRFD
jgi:TolB protein